MREKLNNTIAFLMIISSILFISCRRDPVTCDQKELTDLIFITDSEVHYKPKKALLESYIPNSNFDTLLFRRNMNNLRDMPPESRKDIVINFNIQGGLSSANAYRLILDDSLVYDITNIKLRADTFGMTGIMGGPHISCRLDSFNVNGTIIESMHNTTIMFPLQMHKPITDNK